MTDIERLWPTIAPYGACLWFAKHKEHRPLGGVLHSPTQLEACVSRMNTKGYDTYIGLNPAVPNGIKARRANVKELRLICLDLDPAVDGASPSRSVSDLWTCLGLSGSTISPPWATVLDSGRGAQVWVHLEPIELKDEAHRVEMEGQVNQFIHETANKMSKGSGCRLDTSTSDLCRVARIPTSINSKTGRPASLQVLATERLAPKAILRPVERTATKIDRAPLDADLTNLGRLLLHLTDKARRFLTEGVEEPGRHQAAFATAASLKEVGVEAHQAIEWVCHGGVLCRPSLPIRECVRAVNSAYRG